MYVCTCVRNVRKSLCNRTWTHKLLIRQLTMEIFQVTILQNNPLCMTALLWRSNWWPSNCNSLSQKNIIVSTLLPPIPCVPYLEIYLSKHLRWILNPLPWLILEISWRDKKDDGSSSVTGSGETKGCVVWASLGWPTSANYFLTKTITSHN